MYRPSDMACNQSQEPDSCGLERLFKTISDWSMLMENPPTNPNPQWNSLQAVPPPFPSQGISETERIMAEMEANYKDFKAMLLPPPQEKKSYTEEVMEAMATNVQEFAKESKNGFPTIVTQLQKLESQVEQRSTLTNEGPPTTQLNSEAIPEACYESPSSIGEEESDEELWTAPLHSTPPRQETNAAASGAAPELPQANVDSMIQNSSMLGSLFKDSDEDSTPQALASIVQPPLFHTYDEGKAQEESSRIEEPLMDDKDGDGAVEEARREFQSKHMRYLLPHTFTFSQDGERRDPTWVEGKHLRDDLALKILFYDPP